MTVVFLVGRGAIESDSEKKKPLYFVSLSKIVF